MNASHEHNELVRQANTTAIKAFVVSVISLLVSGGSLWYAYQQTVLFNQQIVLLKQQNKMQQEELDNLLMVNVVARFEVIQGVKSEVRLVLENKDRAHIFCNNLFVDNVYITEHPLFDPKQFDSVPFDDTINRKRLKISLEPGEIATFLTVASVPTAKTVSLAISHDRARKPVFGVCLIGVPKHGDRDGRNLTRKLF